MQWPCLDGYLVPIASEAWQIPSLPGDWFHDNTFPLCNSNQVSITCNQESPGSELSWSSSPSSQVQWASPLCQAPPSCVRNLCSVWPPYLQNRSFVFDDLALSPACNKTSVNISSAGDRCVHWDWKKRRSIRGRVDFCTFRITHQVPPWFLLALSIHSLQFILMLLDGSDLSRIWL